ncbi:hypothetical protein PILCRDRAFT_712794 [Piloderma croceum F 1598]|uniref:Uncharacterized protein n=1 Tax=Piloderma croceum (strain F 1598) TaxID=765440 RepID=A0A0C3AJW8_PILCF|nr:hypothetical protein PILCRDRAFT_712794 [Piloderma croceum F 1598]
MTACFCQCPIRRVRGRPNYRDNKRLSHRKFPSQFRVQSLFIKHLTFLVIRLEVCSFRSVSDTAWFAYPTHMRPIVID